MADEAGKVRIFLTLAPLVRGEIQEAYATVRGDVAFVETDTLADQCYAGEGYVWHRTKWAAQNYACGMRDEQLRKLRAEVDRLERMTFGRLR